MLKSPSASNPIRVLHLVTWLNPGGIEQWLLGFIKANLGGNVAMEVCCRMPDAGRMAEELIAEGVRVSCCPMLPNPLTYRRRLCEIIRRFDADIVHNHLGATSLLAVHAAKRSGCRIVSTFHSPAFDPQSQWTKKPVVKWLRARFAARSLTYAIEQSDLVTGVSQSVLDAIPDWSANTSPSGDRFRVTYLGIPHREPPVDCPASIRERAGWPDDAPLVVKLGRLSAEKNPLACLDIFRHVLRQVPAARMAFIGDGPLAHTVRRRLEETGLTDQVALLGYRPDAMQLLAQSNLLLHPSKYEGFGLAVAEAASLGVPAVTSDAPGLREAVIHGKTGFIHCTDDLEGMAASVIRLLTERDLHAAFASQAKLHAKNRFSPAVCQRDMISLYEWVLGRDSA